MKTSGEGNLLRVFIGEADKWHGRPLYEEIILLAKKTGMAGATAIKGFYGFGSKSHMHTANLLRLSEDLPVIIEIVDSKERIDQFLPLLNEMIGDGLVTLEEIEILKYRA